MNLVSIDKKQEQARVCQNCTAPKTSLWRKGRFGELLCNSCALFFKKYHVHRDYIYKGEKIKRRRRQKAPKGNNLDSILEAVEIAERRNSSSSNQKSSLLAKMLKKRIHARNTVLPSFKEFQRFFMNS